MDSLTESWDDWNPTNRHGAKSSSSMTTVENPWRGPRSIASQDEEMVEFLELAEDDEPWTSEALGKRRLYRDGNTIDWMTEEAAERSRKHSVRSQRGIRGLLMPIIDASRVWFVLIVTGVGVGFTGAWLDVLTAWLSDIRSGKCSYGFFYNQVSCCSGLDVGEVCTEWLSWSDTFGVQSSAGRAIIQGIIYVGLAVAYAGSAGVFVSSYAPYAFHTGIPEIKAILGGYVFDSFLSPWTLLVKALGLALTVASGLSLGKEGPLVHVSCCMAYLATSVFKDIRYKEAQKRRLLAAAAAAGVSVAFGSPLGAVIFGLEELELFSNGPVIWRAFVTSVIAAVSLQYIDPFGTGNLVLFQVKSNDVWRAFELIPWLALAAIGGVLGSWLIKLNMAAAVYRRKSLIHEWPLIEVIVITTFTAIICYPVVFLRVQSSELVVNLFRECDPVRGDYHGLCNAGAMWQNVVLLLITVVIKIGLTAWTFGIKIPAGIFLPTITIGASLGRAMGLLMQGLHRAWPKAWIFSACPPDPTVRCISLPLYGVIGSAAMLGGVTRMTISVVVILFELTGALSHVLPIMITVMVSKWVADAFGKEGIYASWTLLHSYPSLPTGEYRDKGEAAKDVMVPLERVIVINGSLSSIEELNELTKAYHYYGYPVLERDILIGFVTRERLIHALEPLPSDGGESGHCTFLTQRANPTFSGVNLSSAMEHAPMQLKQGTPLEVVITMFQKMNLRYLLFCERGRLTGLMTKRDVVSLMTPKENFPDQGVLAGKAE